MFKNRFNLRNVAAMAVCLAGITMFSGCDETENVPDIKPENEAALTQTAFADETGVKSDVTFVTAGAWTSSVTEGAASKSAGMATGSVKAGTGSWITITPDHGDAAGKYTVVITLTPNTTGEDRTAMITVSCNGTDITVTVTQKATKEDGTVPDDDDDDDDGQGDLKYTANDGTVSASAMIVSADQKVVYDGGIRHILLSLYAANRVGIAQLRFFAAGGASSDRLTAGTYTGIAPHSFQPSSVNTFFANERFNLGNTENTLFFYTPQGSIGSSITVSLTGSVYTISFDIKVALEWSQTSYLSSGRITGGYTGAIPQDGTSDPSTPTGITLSAENITVVEGDDAPLTAYVTPDGASQIVSWNSSNGFVAYYNPNKGAVTAVGAGDATITAVTANGLTASCEITVVTGGSGGEGSLLYLSYADNKTTTFPIRLAEQTVVYHDHNIRQIYVKPDLCNMPLHFTVAVNNPNNPSTLLPGGTYGGIPWTSDPLHTSANTFFAGYDDWEEGTQGKIMLGNTTLYFYPNGSSITVTTNGSNYLVDFSINVTLTPNSSPPTGQIGGSYTGAIRFE